METVRNGSVMDIDTLQEIVRLAWDLSGYGDTFLANQANHRDFAHGLVHIIKACGHLSEYVDEKDHKGFSGQKTGKYLADIVISVMRMCNTHPGMDMSIASEIRGRLIEKFSKNMKLTGLGRAIQERFRQVNVEGWTEEHDDEHEDGELALAARCYEIYWGRDQDTVEELGVPPDWPWAAEWWKPNGKLRNLEKAAALNLAEIERLKRINLDLYTRMDEIIEKEGIPSDDNNSVQPEDGKR